MARPTKYATEEERREADAERKRLARGGAPTEPAESPAESPELEQPGPYQRKMPITLKDYLHRELRATEAFCISTGLEGPQRLERMKASERYLRWRYQGVLNGEVASL